MVVLGIALSAFTWSIGQSLHGTTSALVDHDLPLVGAMFDLKIAVVREEPILYEYYATADRENFEEAHNANWALITQGLDRLRNDFPNHADAAEAATEIEKVRTLAANLDGNMSRERIDWDAARATLVDVTEHAARANAAVDRLMLQVRRSAGARGSLNRDQVDLVVALVVMFSTATVLLLFASGYFLRRYLREAEERRLLALFPERNPHPILSVAPTGTTVYANPGAQALAATLPDARGQPEALLPPDLPQRLARIEVDRSAESHFEYEIFGRSFSCEIHPVQGQSLAHVYLLDITDRRRIEQRLLHQAYHDPMTGLPNRYRFDDRVAALLSSGREVSVWLLAIDRFRLFVDSFGRRSVEALLQETARRLAAGLAASGRHASDLELFRVDGAQFAVLDCRPGDDDGKLTAAVQAALRDPVIVENRELLLTVSVGGAVGPRDSADADALFRCADRALQAVRKSGGSGFMRYHGDLEAQLLERLELETALRRAAERGELVLHYQPQVSTSSGQLAGFEALVRWQHPQKGMIPPASFIPLAEETGLINEIGAWVLEAACRQARAWHDAGLRDFSVGVNISARQFAGSDLPALVRDTIERAGIDPRCLDLEITESVAMHDVEGTIATLRTLKDIGVRLSIDDFGTGYSSLAYLKRFPLDRLKVDRSFVTQINVDEGSAALARGVIALAKGLGLKAIAEGVETPQQRHLLERFGCDQIQGFLISRPQPPAALHSFIETATAHLHAAEAAAGPPGDPVFPHGSTTTTHPPKARARA
jgi:diguanylate cyclase (GGDEF)-like protein